MLSVRLSLVQDISMIFDVIVHPKMRGRGLGKQVTVAAMRQAKEDDYKTCALTATNDAKLLYEKIGFQSVKKMAVYS